LVPSPWKFTSYNFSFFPPTIPTTDFMMSNSVFTRKDLPVFHAQNKEQCANRYLCTYIKVN
jgi:hypothetical protein